jgi:hypothetical protein
MIDSKIILSRREALAGIGLAGTAAVAHAAWKPFVKIGGRPENGEIIRVSAVGGADDAERIINAFKAAPDGATILFDPGVESRIDRLVSIGTGGDGRNARGIRVVANGHKFIYTADGARLEFNGPISALLDLTADYSSGSRALTISHRSGQLAAFIPGRWIKIVSDALDGWNRNRGNQQGQYRLGEWALIRSVVDHGNGTATLALSDPLKFTRGFINTGNARQLVEVDAYTRTNRARVFAVLCDRFSWEGGAFYVEDAEDHLGPNGWNTRSLLRVQGFVRPVIQRVALGPGVGKGLEIHGCVDFTVNSPQVQGLPDFAARSTRGPVRAGVLGYGISIAGCWRGVVNDLVGKDCRHAITEAGSTASANSSTYGILLSMGRTYGTRINNARLSGRFSAAIDTHQGAHAWIISNPLVQGLHGGFGITLRGPNHTVIAPNISADRGIQVYSEFDNDGGSDLPGLVGKGNQWMSSAMIVGGTIDCTTEALVARNAYLTVQNGMRIRSRSHEVFSSDGSVLDFASGTVDVEVTGTGSAGDVRSGRKQRAIFECGDSNPSYGITWTPGVIIRRNASVDVDAASVSSTGAMHVFGQDGASAEVVVKGNLQVLLPRNGTGSPFANSIRYQIDRAARVQFRGNGTIPASFGTRQ